MYNWILFNFIFTIICNNHEKCTKHMIIDVEIVMNTAWDLRNNFLINQK